MKGKGYTYSRLRTRISDLITREAKTQIVFHGSRTRANIVGIYAKGARPKNNLSHPSLTKNIKIPIGPFFNVKLMQLRCRNMTVNFFSNNMIDGKLLTIKPIFLGTSELFCLSAITIISQLSSDIIVGREEG